MNLETIGEILTFAGFIIVVVAAFVGAAILACRLIDRRESTSDE